MKQIIWNSLKLLWAVTAPIGYGLYLLDYITVQNAMLWVGSFSILLAVIYSFLSAYRNGRSKQLGKFLSKSEIAELKVQLRYDATAPAVAGARARRDRKVVRVTWKRPADAAAIEVERTPGVDGRTSTVVYQGRGESFVDRSVRAGAVYRYEIRAFDAAGNVGTLQVSTGQAQALHRPAAGAVVRAPVVLAWKAAANARFYNVQLYRGGRKVLSAWPKGSTFRLGRGWVYAGAKQSLRPGLYRWYVWPARGTRERPVYGAVLGSSTFRVR